MKRNRSVYDNIHNYFINQTDDNLNDLIDNHLKHIKIKSDSLSST